MAEIDGEHRANVEDQTHPTSCFPTVPFLQKVLIFTNYYSFFLFLEPQSLWKLPLCSSWTELIAEVLGTYFVIFAGCAAVVVNADKEKVVGLPGISIVWGLVVMVMVYSVGHISGAHFNPAVTIAFASCRRFPVKQVKKTNFMKYIFFLFFQVFIENLYKLFKYTKKYWFKSQKFEISFCLNAQ
ncbi:putative major intrinsic protein [Helianthus annuus]|nr:putative major intrinsic protein [Helianthus annuus]KAJ0686601.1 putative major intrinsic protein [Helianthus annuus]KAJ0690415.1 putative major intrinsic protein [Helianthus annuus]